jgi:23S rRNA pseudouridine955/2504/2580 synthase
MVFGREKHASEDSKSVSMEVEQIENKKNFVLFKIILNTGRKHQIRSTLSYFGIPVVGDKKYGSDIELENEINLLAYKVVFEKLNGHLSYLNGKSFEVKNFFKL